MKWSVISAASLYLWLYVYFVAFLHKSGSVEYIDVNVTNIFQHSIWFVTKRKLKILEDITKVEHSYWEYEVITLLLKEFLTV